MKKYFEMFIELLVKEGKSKNTITSYRNDLRKLENYLAANNIENINEITYAVLNEFKLSLKDGASTINRIIACMRSFFSFLEDYKYIKENPVEKIKNIKIKNKKEAEFLDKKEINTVTEELLQEKEREKGAKCFDYIESRNKIMIMMLLKMGLRSVEIRELKISDVNGDELKVLGKGEKYRYVYIPASIINLFNEYLEVRENHIKKTNNETDLLFVSYRCKLIGNNTLNKIVKKAAESVDKEVHTHTMRHSAASSMISNNVPLNTVSKILGHSSTQVTSNIYVHSSKDEVREAMKNN